MNQPSQPNSEFTALWVEAQPFVSSYILSAVRDGHSADDILQEVAAAAVAGFPDYDQERPFLNWVLGIARNRILHYYRSTKRDRLLFDTATLAALAQAHESLDKREGRRRSALIHCVRNLRERARLALAMRYSENMSVKTIAERWDTTPNAVSLLLFRSRKSLEECIEKELVKAEEGK